MESAFTFLLRNEEAFIHTFAPHHHEFQAASGREYVGCPVSIISFYKHYGTLTVSVGVRIHTLYGGSIGHWRAWRGLMILHASITWSRSRFSFAIAVVCGRCHGSLFLRRCSLSLSCQYLSPYIHRPPSPMDNLYPQTRSRPPLVGYILSMSISYRNPTTSQQLRPQLRLCLIPPSCPTSRTRRRQARREAGKKKEVVEESLTPPSSKSLSGRILNQQSLRPPFQRWRVYSSVESGRDATRWSYGRC